MSGRFERQDKSQRKHPVKSSSTPRFGTTPGGTITRRPEWKGPSFNKPKTTIKIAGPAVTKGKQPEASIQADILPIDLQQLLLNIFRDSFEIATDLERLTSVVQDVKERLYGRDFEGAFKGADRLEAYSVRWSPGRALCYAAVLAEIWGIMGWNDGKKNLSPSKIVSFGGGAAEVVAFGGLLRFMHPQFIGLPASASEHQVVLPLEELHIADIIQSERLNLHLVDIAAWQTTTEVLAQSLFTLPPLSKYASISARAANRALLTSKNGEHVLQTSFQQSDILTLNGKELKDICCCSKSENGRPVLVTLFFTLNELYCISRAKTTAFLLELTDSVPKGSTLLVVDSPDGYSETTIPNKEKTTATNEGSQKGGSDAKITGIEKKERSLRRYPMIWLLEHVLLGGLEGARKGQEDDSNHSEDDQIDIDALKWEKVLGDDARWFRLDEKLKYPVKLEGIRFQMHVFRRL